MDLITLALFNTMIGLNNVERNTEQENIQKEILSKLDCIINRLDNMNVSNEHI